MSFINPIFNIFEPQVIDNSIAQYEYVRYATVNGLDVTTYSGPTYTIETKDLDSYLLPQHGYLDLVFRIGGVNGVAGDISHDNAVHTELHQNVMSLFQKASYFINKVGVDEVDLPALTTTIRNLLDYSQDYLDKQGASQWFYSDSGATVHTAGISQNGRFSAVNPRAVLLKVAGASNLAQRVRVMVPLNRIFGYLSDYPSCMRGLEHRFEFVKQSKIAHAVLCNVSNAAQIPQTISFDEMSIWMPKLVPSPEAEAFFLKQIRENSSSMITYDAYNGYRQQQVAGEQLNWQISTLQKRPKYVFVSFQDKARLDSYDDGVARTNPGVFDNLLVNTIELRVNSKRFPLEQYRLDFSAATNAKADNYQRAFKDWLRISNKDQELDNGSIVSYFDYANTYPIYAFDLSNDHSLFENIQSNYIELIVQFANPGPAGPYYSNAVITWEKELKIASAGESITIIRT